MITQKFNWSISHSKTLDGDRCERIPATVPGAIGLDYAKAKNYPPYYFANNFELFRWMEDEYFIYDTVLSFDASENEFARLKFDGIDYEYSIRIDGKEYAYGEGFFAPVELDVTALKGGEHKLEVIVYPAPKATDARRKNTRDEAHASCKPASTYGWDWHPRLIPSGIWKDVTLEIHEPAVTAIEAKYRMTDDLKHVSITAELSAVGTGNAEIALLAPSGDTVYSGNVSFKNGEAEELTIELDNPLLWYPRGYGEQPLYTFVCKNKDFTIERRIGFRRVKLVRNADDVQIWEAEFPKTRLPAPATFEVNGVKVFAKGSNWVNTEIFPALATEKRYDELLEKVCYANMNILRLWGGQYINHDYFYDRCDELGIMVWQEFMLSCNLYPDDDKYLSVLKKEATAIIKSLRTHPCLSLWCGGNELFNSWSGMTNQSHPLRVLDALCYEHDRFTPFNHTSPLYGMGHGTYVTLFKKHKAGIDLMGLGGEMDYDTDEEFITVLCRSSFTAYTEFGSAGGADPEYVKKYIMDEKDYLNRSPKNPVWVSHHAYHAWGAERWLNEDDMNYYFGGFKDTDELLRRSLVVQAASYKSVFEEMRRQWPHCSMAINWDFNEPWPCIAGNSLLNWPCEPKPALHAVSDALRPTIASVKTGRNRFLTGEVAKAEVWILNDSAKETEPITVNVYLDEKDGKRKIATVSAPACPARENRRGEEFEIEITDKLDTFFGLSLEVEGKPEYDSHYTFIKK